jgi:hypothetical protein
VADPRREAGCLRWFPPPLYDGPMDLRLDTVPSEGWIVALAAALDRRETSELFMLGDKLISWPTADLVSFGDNALSSVGTSAGPFLRSGMYLSEIVSRPEGVRLVYGQEPAARMAARVIEYQMREVFAGS